MEERSHHWPAGFVLREGAVEAAGAGNVAAGRAFYFYDLGAHVGEQPAGVGQGEDIGGVHHPDALEGESAYVGELAIR